MAVYLIVLLTLVAQGALAFYQPPTCPKQLRSSFYASSCPRFIEVVNRIVQADTVQDPQMPAHLIRLMFHDCAVQGCDASVMLKTIPNIPSERDADDNLSFGLMTGGYGTINSIKEKLEAICPQVVSCADIIIAAAASGLKAAGGPRVEVKFGRRDGLTSFKAAPDVILPHFHQSPKASLRTMKHIGLNTKDTVALVGTHTIGTANCWRFYDRINGTFDSRLNPEYARKLNATCVPPSPDSDGLWPWLHLDNVTSTKFDNQYYKNLLKGYGLLNTDAGLLDRPDTKMLVQAYAADEAMWKNQYTASFLKLSELSYLVAPQGEIRRHCERVRRPTP